MEYDNYAVSIAVTGDEASERHWMTFSHNDNRGSGRYRWRPVSLHCPNETSVQHVGDGKFTCSHGFVRSSSGLGEPAPWMMDWRRHMLFCEERCNQELKELIANYGAQKALSLLTQLNSGG